MARHLIGDGYTWIDYTTDVVRTTPQELANFTIKASH